MGSVEVEEMGNVEVINEEERPKRGRRKKVEEVVAVEENVTEEVVAEEENPQRTALVIGHKGFMGSFMTPVIAETFNVHGYDLLDGQDARDYNTLLEAMGGVDAVLHLASIPMYSETIQPSRYVTQNVFAVATAFEACRNSKARHFVFVSSGALYGFGPKRPLEGWVKPPIRERLPKSQEELGMLDSYSAVKVASERLFNIVCSTTRRKISVTSLRINCIEPYHTGARDNGAHWGWWCSQELATKAVIAALNRESDGYQTVNVGEENEFLDRTALLSLLNGKM
jgi:nucleoside-diphosphate-sugar epimerase